MNRIRSSVNVVIESFLLIRIVPSDAFALLLFIRSRVVTARLITMATHKHHTKLSFIVESTLGLTKEEKPLKVFLRPLRILSIKLCHSTSIDGLCILNKVNNDA